MTLFNVSLLPTMICCWGLAVYRLTLPNHPLLTIFVGSFFCVLRTGAEEMGNASCIGCRQQAIRASPLSTS